MENRFRAMSQYFIVIAILIIFAFDAYVYLRGGQDATISSIIITDWAYNYPAFTFGIGFVMGHLFWPLSKKKYKPEVQ